MLLWNVPCCLDGLLDEACCRVLEPPPLFPLPLLGLEPPPPPKRAARALTAPLRVPDDCIVDASPELPVFVPAFPVTTICPTAPVVEHARSMLMAIAFRAIALEVSLKKHVQTVDGRRQNSTFRSTCALFSGLVRRKRGVCDYTRRIDSFG